MMIPEEQMQAGPGAGPAPAGPGPDMGAGGPPPPGPGGPHAELAQELRQLDQEQLVELAVQLITRLQEIESQMGAEGPGGPAGGPAPGPGGPPPQM